MKGRARITNQYIEESKAKHNELDGGRTNWGGRRDATDAMDKVLPGITRIWDLQEYIVSKQHEHDVIGRKREEIYYKKHKTYKRALLLHKGLGRNWGSGNQTLPDRENVGGSFPKATTRCTVQKIWGRNHEHTR